MYQVPGSGVGNGSKFRACISLRTAAITGSFMADWFIRTLPPYIGVKSLLNIIDTTPRIFYLRSRFVSLRLGMGSFRLLRQRCPREGLRDVKLT